MAHSKRPVPCRPLHHLNPSPLPSPSLASPHSTATRPARPARPGAVAVVGAWSAAPLNVVHSTLLPLASGGGWQTFGGGPAHLMSHGLASLISATSRRVNCENSIGWFPLEDVAIGIWIDNLKTAHHDVEMINNRRFFVFRYCHENAFNTLLERGQPLFVDPNATMLQMVENERVILGGGGAKFCPTGTAADNARSNAAAAAAWPALSKQMQGVFEQRLPGMIAEWQASATTAATSATAASPAAASLAAASPEAAKGSTDVSAIAAEDGGVRCNHESGAAAGAECVGAAVEVYWADDRLWYRATVLWFGGKKSLHMVRYEADGLIEKIDLTLEPWRVTAQSQPSSAAVAEGARTPNPSLDAPLGLAASPREASSPRTAPLAGAQELEGQEIEVYWPDDDAWYAGTVQWFDNQRQMHLIRYTADGLFEKVNLKHERVRMGGKEYGGAVNAGGGATGPTDTTPAPPPAAPTPPPAPPPSPPPSPVATKFGGAKSGAAEILVIVPDRMPDWHPYLAGEGKVQVCAAQSAPLLGLLCSKPGRDRSGRGTCLLTTRCAPTGVLVCSLLLRAGLRC